MDDFSRLQQKLAKLRRDARSPGDARQLRASTPERLLAAIVTEIDETILPRRLSFTTSKGRVLHFAAANRRLQAFLDPAPKVLGASADGLTGEALGNADEARVGALKSFLLAALKGADALSVKSARQSGGGFASDVGIPAALVSRAWDLPLPGEDGRDPAALVADFAQAVQDHAVAWIVIAGEEVAGEGGDPAMIDELSEQAALFLDAVFAKRSVIFGLDDGPQAIAVGPVGAANHAALYVDAVGHSGFFAISPEALPQVFRTWTEISLG